MFTHNFKYSFLTLLRNKSLLFWTLLFPLVLGLFFSMAFSDIEKSEKFDTISIAIIDTVSFRENPFYQESFKSLSDKDSENYLLDITYTTEDKAKAMLEEGEITGYLTFTDDVKITVNSAGINETILRYVVDEINSSIEIYSTLSTQMSLEQNYPSLNKEVVLQNVSRSNLSYTMIEYYTLIAMTCLYGGILSMYVTNYKLANMNSVGKRTSISPLKKGSMLLGSLCASYVIQLVGLSLLFLFTIFVLHVDYGTHLLPIILLSCCGSFAGLSFGVSIATLVKANDNAKTGILIAVTMLGCFFSGMMGITTKYFVDKYVPILNRVNPASMITDGLYSLYYYDTYTRYIGNVVGLLVFSILMLLLSYKELRRQKYDSI